MPKPLRENEIVAKGIRTQSLSIEGVVLPGGVLLGTSQKVDLDGKAAGLTIDADADTYLEATTDDTVDIYISGAKDFSLTANTLTALSGSTIATNTIAETTAASGVTIDGLLVKDGKIDAANPAQELTASGAITINNGLVMLNHATVAIAATLDAPVAGDELFIVDSSASGTAAHTVTTEAGVTWDGTNNTATLNAPDEALHVIALSATRWYIVDNNGSVGLSSV